MADVVGELGQVGPVRTREGRKSGREEVERHLPPRNTHHSARGESNTLLFQCFLVKIWGGGGDEGFILYFFSFFKKSLKISCWLHL